MSTIPEDVRAIMAAQGEPSEDAVEDLTGFNPQANLRAMREETEARFGNPTQLPTSEPGQIRTALDLFRRDPRNADVDVSSGLEDAGTRLGVAIRRGQNRERYLDQQFGPGGWRVSQDGRLVVDVNGKERLIDEIGFSYGDILDAADTAIDVTAGVAAGTAAVTLGAGPASTSALAALGTAGVGSLVDLWTTVGDRNMQRYNEIFEERGGDAAIDFLTGVIPAQVGKVLSKGPDMSDVTPGDVDSAIGRIRQATGVEVPATAAQRTGSPTLGRIESIGEKLPASGEVFKQAAADQENALREAQRVLAGESQATQETLVDTLNRNLDNRRREVEAAALRLDDTLMRRLDGITDVAGSQGKDITPSVVGQKIRSAHYRLRQTWQQRNRELYDEVDGLPGGSERIVSPDAIRAVGDALDDLPIKDYFPASLKSKIKVLQNQEGMTLREARNARSFIGEAIGDGEALDGVDTAMLRRVHSAFTTAINEAVANLPEETASALNLANRHYASQADKWLSPGVVESFIPITSRAFKEDADLAGIMLGSTDPAKIMRMMEDLTPDEKRFIGRGMWNKVVDQSTEGFPAGTVSTSALLGNLQRMPREVLNQLFAFDGTAKEGAKRVDDMFLTLNALAQRQGLIEIDLNTAVPKDITRALRTQAVKERLVARNYKSKVLQPFIRDEVGETQIKAEDFMRHVTSLDASDVNIVMRKLGDESRDGLQKNAIEHILKEGTVAAQGDQVIRGVVNPGQSFVHGPSLSQAIERIGDKKLNALVGEQNTQILKDIATIRTSQAQKQASSAGGLIAGGLISLLFASPMTALPVIAQYRVLSSVLTNQKVAKLATAGSFKSQARDAELGTLSLSAIAAQEILDEVAVEDPDVNNKIRLSLQDMFGVEIEQTQAESDDDVSRILQHYQNGVQ